MKRTYYRRDKLITRRQIEDWLIYHCELELGTYQYPFVVQYWIGIMGIRSALRQTPWEAYHELALSIFKNPELHRYISKQYWDF